MSAQYDLESDAEEQIEDNGMVEAATDEEILAEEMRIAAEDTQNSEGFIS